MQERTRSQMLEDLVMNLSNHAETGQIPKPYRRGSWRPIGEDEYIKMLHARVLDNNTHHEQQQQLLLQQQHMQHTQHTQHMQHLPSHNICCYCNNNATELHTAGAIHNNNDNNNTTTTTTFTHRHNNNNNNYSEQQQQQLPQQQQHDSQQQQQLLQPQQHQLLHQLQLSTSSLTHTSCCAMLHLCARHSMCDTPPRPRTQPLFTAAAPTFFRPACFFLPDFDKLLFNIYNFLGFRKI